MKIKLPIVIIGALVLLSSCSQVYTPALYHQDIAYLPKPASFDKESTANYVSAGLNMHTNTNFNDVLVSGQVNLSRANTFDNFNVAYGAFGSFGDYQTGSSDKAKANYFRDKFFGAVGGRFSANFFVNNDRADIRFIGVEAAYSHEFGDYADFRKFLVTQPGYKVDARTDLFSIGLTSEILFHNQNDTDFQHGIRGYLGTTLGYNPINEEFYSGDTATQRMFRNIYPKASYFIKFKDYFGTIEVGSAVFLRAGLKF
ncbi:hypothetical protein ACFQZS_06715 [Mucilaginibacter calamicampi]|uniref:Outer membrane protein beta-barrel domain-containing protein n=1 Tax=Mucilaginibacter calamicampi TaxID=1302352 RepID=A0ABW2YTR1_9SPHI